jgi:uncharacterized membrane protein
VEYPGGVGTWVAIHVASGALALAFGLVAMLVRKGSRPHVLAGRAYLVAVAVVLISTIPILPLVVERQQPWVAEYLISIDVLVLYLAASGARRAARRRSRWPDVVIMAVGVIIALAFLLESIQDARLMMMLMDAMNAPIDLDTSTASFFLAVFGIGILLMTVEDWYLITHPQVRGGRLSSTHLGRMAGSYLGLVTAVVVVNLSRPLTDAGLPQWIVWLTPALIGAILIAVKVRQVGKRP